MKIGIVIATYLNKVSKITLYTALLSVKNQTYKEYKVFLIGDNYEDENEFFKLSQIIDFDKIYVENLKIAKERSKYKGKELWVCGGVNATNIGIKKALEEGYNYICILNHDDIFLEDHLEVIVNGINKTKSKFITTLAGRLPECNSNDFYIPYKPINSHLFLVSVCLDYSYYKMLFRNMIEEENNVYPSDADLWNRIKKYMENNNETGILINKQTCKKIGEGFTYMNKIIKVNHNIL